MSDDVMEVVLPSGRFARVGPVKGRHLLETHRRIVTQKQDSVFALIALVCTVDDKPITYEELLDMDFRDALKLHSLVSKYLESPVQGPT